MVDPASVTLEGAGAHVSLLVTGTNADGEELDLTHDASFRVKDPAICRVNERGEVWLSDPHMSHKAGCLLIAGRLSWRNRPGL